MQCLAPPKVRDHRARSSIKQLISFFKVDTSPDIVFRGTDGNECEAFVVAIRDLAFAKGMDEDYRWMLRLATTRLRGKALRWHARLEPSIEQDWDLFVQALFDQYPSMEEPAGPGISAPVWCGNVQSPSRR